MSAFGGDTPLDLRDGQPRPARVAPVAAALVLASGETFEGELIGAQPGNGAIRSGEVVFNTSLSGYQEIITDPSYAGQIITFTYPHIGNYGTNPADNESGFAACRGVIVRELSRRHSNWVADQSLEAFLEKQGLSGLSGIDTRRLTRLIRDNGAVPGAFGAVEGANALSFDALTQAAKAEPGTAGVDLVSEVTAAEPYIVSGLGDQVQGAAARRIVAMDFGMKRTIGHQLARLGTVEVVPAATSAGEILGREPDGVFLSNGPGDPEMSPYAIEAIRELIGRVPIFGICLGHQLLSLAAGGAVVKLPFGHHGANHPVRDVLTGKVEITSQNHNFAVDAGSVATVADLTHVNLNDGVCEGIALRDEPAFSVQHHPEASPGPHDSRYLFERFVNLMDGGA